MIQRLMIMPMVEFERMEMPKRQGLVKVLTI
jgi:hypothetical protein